MKTYPRVGNRYYLLTIALFSFIICSINLNVLPTHNDLKAQSRTAGQMVVPRGWEGHDSIRFGTFDQNMAGINDSLDKLSVNFRYEWGPVQYSDSIIGKRRGIVAYGRDKCSAPDFTYLGTILKQRTFYPRLYRYSDITTSGFNWRYIDTTGYSYHDNRYDSNDISPYAEFKANPGIVTGTFNTKRFASFIGSDTNDQTVTFGNEGRVICGYSDQRTADNLLRVIDEHPFRSYYPSAWWWSSADTCDVHEVSRPLQDMTFTEWKDERIAIDSHSICFIQAGPARDTAQRFSLNLEFNLDTNSIDVTGSALDADNVPLLRLQVLFKKGEDNTAGWPVLPFVPFKTASDLSKPGWFQMLDTVITKKSYRSYMESWRKEDVLKSGSPSHSWKFKQLHIVLDSVILPILNLTAPPLPFDINTNTEPIRAAMGKTPKESNPFGLGFQHPDFLVGLDSNLGDYTVSGNAQRKPLIEVRILSTYRSTARVRSLSWNDTNIDKYLYRIRINSDSTHSLSPLDAVNSTGIYQGYDDSILTHVNRYANRIPAGVQREVLINDVQDPFGEGSQAATGLVDYFLSKRNIHSHIREQELGNWSLQFRRERMSYDAKPPSVFENQVGTYYSNRSGHGSPGNLNDPISDIFPGDYIPDDALGSGIWPSDPKDTSVGLIIGRPGAPGSNFFEAHDQYLKIQKLRDICLELRGSARNALGHPKSKRMALEASPQIWGIIHTKARKIANYDWVFPKDTIRNPDGSVYKVYDHAYAHYNQRPTTPEELRGTFFASMANGASSFNDAQCVDGGGPKGGAPGAFGVQLRDSAGDWSFPDNSYNFGYRRTQFSPWDTWLSPTSNEVDTVLPAYYLGYSNTYRMLKKTIERINQVYTTRKNPFPYRRFEWLDAYSRERIDLLHYPSESSTEDLISYQSSPFKVLNTIPVNPWLRDAKNNYIDSNVVDSNNRSYVEVGLFADTSLSNNFLGPRGRAALIVNKRLWPSLRDLEDSIYLNSALAAKDRSRSLYGDIDVRKIKFQIDTSQFEPAFRSHYYVVRDLFHRDTTYLVHSDSALGTYFKPGDARFFYVEKGVSIRASKQAAVGSSPYEFAFNNGRRVAERMNGTRTVVTYTRDNKLYVSYPSLASTIPGYNIHGSGDAITTGHEELLDSGYCTRPSICTAWNDTSVAIVYWKEVPGTNGGGEINTAYQPHPDSAWSFASFPLLFNDTSIDNSIVTPVIAPCGDSAWFIIAVRELAPLTSSLIGLRMNTHKDGATDFAFTPSVGWPLSSPTYVAALKKPTITSRPIPDASFPVRYAFEWLGRIYYNRIRFNGGTWPILENDTTSNLSAWPTISDDLASKCENHNPCISMNATDTTILTSVVIGPFGGKLLIPVRKYQDEVVWDTKLDSTKRIQPWATKQYVPVLRVRHEYVPLIGGAVVPQPGWEEFNVFLPTATGIGVTNLPGYRYPSVNSEQQRLNGQFFYNPSNTGSGFHDRVRVAWRTGKNNILFAHWLDTLGWKQSQLLENGDYPSLPQRTNAFKSPFFFGIDSSMVPRSVVFTRNVTNFLIPSNQNYFERQVKITNGWFPQVSNFRNRPALDISLKPMGTSCLRSAIGLSFPTLQQLRFLPPPSAFVRITPIQWSLFDLALGGKFESSWPATPYSPDSWHSEVFDYDAGDTLKVARSIDWLDLDSLRSGLADAADYLRIRILLKKASDSSYVSTIDSMEVTQATVRLPGYGLDPEIASFTIPPGIVSDQGFITVEISRGNQSNNLSRSITQLLEFDEDSVDFGEYVDTLAEKRSPHNTIPSPSKLKVWVNPNPFNPTTTVTLQVANSLRTEVEIYDVLGNRVRTLYVGEPEQQSLKVMFNASDLPSGSYLLRVRNGSEVLTRKLQLVK